MESAILKKEKKAKTKKMSSNITDLSKFREQENPLEKLVQQKSLEVH